MKCPIDDSPLSVSSREGVEIDFCPHHAERGGAIAVVRRTGTGAIARPRLGR